MRENFKSAIEEFGKGGGGKLKVNDWDNDRDGILAKIILCDQFPRFVFRKQAKAYAFDAIALKST